MQAITNRVIKIQQEDFLPIGEIQSIGTVSTIWRRPWADQYRITCRTHTPSSTPPAQAGERKTSAVTSSARTKIFDACHFTAKQKKPFSTFLTLTLDKLARLRINGFEVVAAYSDVETQDTFEICDAENGRFLRASSVQNELSRFFDAMQKIYARGVKTFYKRGQIETNEDGHPYTAIKYEKGKIEGGKFGLHYKRGKLKQTTWNNDSLSWNQYTEIKYDKSLSYLWVAEAPENEHGEKNMHVHVMLAWRVGFSVFNQWAKRIEKLWGQGFAHLEKIKGDTTGQHAAAYVAGYLNKGEQGEIIGNRYNISSAARAPLWEPVKNYAWHIMGQLIESQRFAQMAKTRPLIQKKSAIKAKIKTAADTLKNSLYASLKKISRELRNVQGGLRFTRNVVIAEGMQAFENFLIFAREAGWQKECKPVSQYGAMLQKKLEKIIGNMPPEFKNTMAEVYKQEAMYYLHNTTKTNEGIIYYEQYAA
jgi:hypothetical protein